MVALAYLIESPIFLEVDAAILITWVGNAAARLAYAASPLVPVWGSVFGAKVPIILSNCYMGDFLNLLLIQGPCEVHFLKEDPDLNEKLSYGHFGRQIF